MAKATLVPVNHPEVNLLLTHEEAQALVDILARIGGHPDTTRRCLADRMANALRDVGFHYSTHDLSGGLDFKSGVE